MKKTIYILLFCCLASSCTSQTNLESLKFNGDISKTILDHGELKKNLAGAYGLKAYFSKKLDAFKIGSISPSTYEFPGGTIADCNNIWIYVDDYKTNRFLGYTFSSANEKDTEKLLEYLKSKYKGVKSKSDKLHGDVYFWDIPETDRWIFVNQSKRKNYFQTTFTVVKRGLRIENASSVSINTIYDDYKMIYPDLLK